MPCTVIYHRGRWDYYGLNEYAFDFPTNDTPIQLGVGQILRVRYAIAAQQLDTPHTFSLYYFVTRLPDQGWQRLGWMSPCLRLAGSAQYVNKDTTSQLLIYPGTWNFVPGQGLEAFHSGYPNPDFTSGITDPIPLEALPGETWGDRAGGASPATEIEWCLEIVPGDLIIGDSIQLAPYSEEGETSYSIPPGRLVIEIVPASVGVLSTTDDNDTLSATGAVQAGATLSKTEDSDTLSATAVRGRVGTVTVTESNDTLSALGGVAGAAGLSTTEADDTLSATATLSLTGATLSVTEADDTLTATAVGTATPSGGLSINEDKDGFTATGEITFTGAGLNIVEDKDGLVATGAAAIPAYLSITEADDVLAATGTAPALRRRCAIF